MTLAGMTLDDVGEKLSFRSLLAFIRHVPASSCLWQARNRDSVINGMWTLDAQLAAAFVDELRLLRWQLMQMFSTKDLRQKIPEPIPRPGIKQTEIKEIYGKEPIPIKDFDAWWKEGEKDG